MKKNTKNKELTQKDKNFLEEYKMRIVKKTPTNSIKSMQKYWEKEPDSKFKNELCKIHSQELKRREKSTSPKSYEITYYKTMPKGWKVDQGARTAPKGTKWINNDESRFVTDAKGKRKFKQALLITDENLFNSRRK